MQIFDSIFLIIPQQKKTSIFSMKQYKTTQKVIYSYKALTQTNTVFAAHAKKTKNFFLNKMLSLENNITTLPIAICASSYINTK